MMQNMDMSDLGWRRVWEQEKEKQLASVSTEINLENPSINDGTKNQNGLNVKFDVQEDYDMKGSWASRISFNQEPI